MIIHVTCYRVGIAGFLLNRRLVDYLVDKVIFER